MKKINFIKISTISILVGYLFVGCSKTELSDIVTSKIGNIEYKAILNPGNDTNYQPVPTRRHYYDNGGNDYSCPLGGHGCLEPVVVSSNFNAIQEIANLIAVKSTTPSSVFETNYELMTEVFGETLTNCVIINKINVAVRGKLDGSDVCLYFIFTNPTTNKNVIVVPVCK